MSRKRRRAGGARSMSSTVAAAGGMGRSVIRLGILGWAMRRARHTGVMESRFGYVDLFIDPNPNCEEGCGLRYKAESAPRAVNVVRYYRGADDAVDCDAVGWSSDGGGAPSEARAVLVEDSGSGSAWLVYGGDWGLRLTPRDGSAVFGEPYLLVGQEMLL